MAYRFRGRFSGTVFRMDARQRLYRKERRIESARRRRVRREALPAPDNRAGQMVEEWQMPESFPGEGPQRNLAGDAVKMLGDVLKNPQVQQAAIALLPKLLGLPSPPRLPMLPPPPGG